LILRVCTIRQFQPALLETMQGNMILFGRMGELEDAGTGVCLFRIPESNDIVGQVITVGGGIRF
jgi:hypothetical protein